MTNEDYETILDAERRCLAATEAILRLLDAAEPFIPRKGNIGSREYREWCEAAREARAATRLDEEDE